MRRRLLVLVLLAGMPATALADDGNFRPYLVGLRAAGMGGAFTALADDPSGPYYNSARLAWARRSQVSASGSLFGLLSGSIADALGDGNDFRYNDLQTFPILTSGIYKLGPDPETSDDAIATSIFVPASFTRDDRDSLGVSQFSFFNSEDRKSVV